jgi:DNA segregation ATPase FtsK/SpoIIIE, S-DNA-T family
MKGSRGAADGEIRVPRGSLVPQGAFAMLDYRRIQRDLLAVALLAAVAFVGISLAGSSADDLPARTVFPVSESFENWCGPTGAAVAHALRSSFGLGCWVLFSILVSANIQVFQRTECRDCYTQLLGGVLLLFSVCVGLQMLVPGIATAPLYGSGGYVGALGSTLLQRELSRAGTAVLVASMFSAGLLLTAESHVIRLAMLVSRGLLALPLKWFAPTWNRYRARRERKREERIARKQFELEQQRFEAEEKRRELERSIALHEERQEIRINPPPPLIKPAPPAISSRIAGPLRIDAGHPRSTRCETHADYELPEWDLLEEPEEFPYELLAERAAIAAATLEKTFQEFKLDVKVVEIDTGPVITQYELELEKGLRLSKVTALADDLAIALRVPSVRVVAPIPGKNTVGVEVPNDKTVMVRLKELIETASEELERQRIPVFLGKDVSGRPLIADLTKMPHLLIAGRTGTGKSVCLNTLILSILMARTPEQVRLLLIDPKMVELSPYKRVPHLMHPVITDMKKAEAALAWAVEKMEERYTLLARTGVRHLDNYNELGKPEVLDRLGIDPYSDEAEKIPDQMPYIVIIADEMADMMMTSGKDVEAHIIRLAQKSRAVGIHLVLATQKPTVDVITGLIKSNLPARISFQVASRTDSRVVLDEMGADKLLGNGDMLYLAPGTSNLTRAQGTYVSDHEVNEVIDFYSQYEPEYSPELEQLGKEPPPGSDGPGGAADRIHDDMYDQAIEVVIREGRGSVSLLQRALGIGYGRAARLVDYMAEDGIVGEYNGSQAREVLYTLEEWDARKVNHTMSEIS